MKSLSNENVTHIEKNGVQYLQFRKLLEYKEIKHAYSLGIKENYRTSRTNKMPLEESKYIKAIDSYKKLCENIGVDYKNIVKTNQEHTDKVEMVTEKINKNEPDFNLEKYNNTDGLITNQKNIILTTTNADCILLLFYDPVQKIIGNVHSGWKGTTKRISVKAVEKMINEFNCRSQDIICCICPSIRKCHFEVEKDVKDIFVTEFKDIMKDNIKNEIIEEKIPNKKWNIDTVLINKIIIQRAGLRPENIVDSGICSVCNSNIIHSYRVEKQGYGLNTAIISKI